MRTDVEKRESRNFRLGDDNDRGRDHPLQEYNDGWTAQRRFNIEPGYEVYHGTPNGDGRNTQSGTERSHQFNDFLSDDRHVYPRRSFESDCELNDHNRHPEMNWYRDDSYMYSSLPHQEREWADPARQELNGKFKGSGPNGYKRANERIKEDVWDRLCDNSHLDARDINVEVISGEVHLNGSVEDKTAKHRAEDCCEYVSGVKDVINELCIRSDSV